MWKIRKIKWVILVPDVISVKNILMTMQTKTYFIYLYNTCTYKYCGAAN